MESDDPVKSYRRFLEHFSNHIDNLSQDGYEAPFRLNTKYIVPSEVEGECLEWTRKYLSIHDCPDRLLPHLSRAVYLHFLSTLTLADFYAEQDQTESSNEDEGHGSDDSDNITISNTQPLHASKLLQDLVPHIHSVVKAWSQEVPPLPVPLCPLRVCSHAIKNTRRKMEDKHVIMTDLNMLFDLEDNPGQAYFAVFDGHGGTEAADYAATHLHLHMVRDSTFDLDPSAAMKRAYKMTDTHFLEKAAREKLRCGTTGVAALIRDSQLFLSWLGDSQAMLVRGGQPIQVMNPHKPEREDERRRIEDLGGTVVYYGAWRVNGNISVSRAIGDAPYKPFISSDADVTTISLTGEEEYLVLACDGLWDVLSPAQVTQVVYKHSHSSPGGLDDVAIGLVNAARDNGSSDNISVVVVLFKATLSVPQMSADSDMLLGLNTLSDQQMDNLNNSSNNQVNFPKPPTLNEKIKSKGKNLQDNLDYDISSRSLSSYNFHHSIISDNKSIMKRDKSPSFLSVPFSQDLVRRAMFHISKHNARSEDTRRMNREQKANKNHEKISRLAESRVPTARSLLKPVLSGSKVKGKYRRKRLRKQGREAETSLELIENEVELGVGWARDETSVSLGSFQSLRSFRKLKPLGQQGGEMDDCSFGVMKNGALELSGTSLNLSSRSTLPRILQSNEKDRDRLSSVSKVKEK